MTFEQYWVMPQDVTMDAMEFKKAARLCWQVAQVSALTDLCEVIADGGYEVLDNTVKDCLDHVIAIQIREIGE